MDIYDKETHSNRDKSRLPLILGLLAVAVLGVQTLLVQMRGRSFTEPKTHVTHVEKFPFDQEVPVEESVRLFPERQVSIESVPIGGDHTITITESFPLTGEYVEGIFSQPLTDPEVPKVYAGVLGEKKIDLPGGSDFNALVGHWGTDQNSSYIEDFEQSYIIKLAGYLNTSALEIDKMLESIGSGSVAFVCRGGEFRSLILAERAKALGKNVIENTNPELGKIDGEDGRSGSGFSAWQIVENDAMVLGADGYLYIDGEKVEHLVVTLNTRKPNDMKVYDDFYLELADAFNWEPDDPRGVMYTQTKIYMFENVDELHIGLLPYTSVWKNALPGWDIGIPPSAGFFPIVERIIKVLKTSP